MNVPSYLSGTIFVKAYRTLRMRVTGRLQQYDLTPTMWSLLGIVMQEQDGVRLSTVASRLEVKAPLVTMLANTLIDRGYIARLPHHTDKRAKLLVMTAKGKKFVATVEADMSKELAALLEGVSNDDLKAYKNVLDTIIKNGER